MTGDPAGAVATVAVELGRRGFRAGGSTGTRALFVLGGPVRSFVFLAVSGLPGPLGALGRFAQVSVTSVPAAEGATTITIALERAAISYEVIPVMLDAIEHSIAIFETENVLVEAGPVTDSRGP